MNKKLRKFLRDPKLYFKDMYLKRSRKIAKLTPKKQIGYFQYTVVSAVYNVEKYLETYFDALIEQRLDFENNIRLILIDDGSTDGSAKIIKRWQQRFPKNIQYFYKENGGQASARNLGLEHVQTEWVTFIDPDDFVDLNYFLEADNFLKKYQNKEIKLLASNLIFFHENKNQFSDTHPLKYRFAKGDCVLPCSDQGKHMQLSASTAIFHMSVIVDLGLRFDSRIKPNFEDGHFVGAYLSDLKDCSIGFSKSAKYFYRKRSDGSSTLDTSWQKETRYSDVLIYGYLDLFNRYSSLFGNVPKHIQRTVLYDLTWYVKVIVNKPESVSFLDNEQRNLFINLIKQLFSFIDMETIVEFELAGCWFFHKVGMLGAFKGQEPPIQIAYLEDYDTIKSQVLIRYFTRETGLEVFRLDGQDILPVFAKTMRHDFVNMAFVHERRLWVPLPMAQEGQLFTVQIGAQKARVTLAGKQHPHGVSVGSIIKHFAPKSGKLSLMSSFAGAWLMMDRDTQADDNAEHLYRYTRQEHPDQRIFFVLREDSHDWNRLKVEGFNLLAFGSADHEAALRACKKIISSHIDQYVVDYFKDGSLSDKQCVFLQHGVTKDDLSAWLNSKKRIDCFITAALPEHTSIAGNFNRYRYTQKEVVLTGFPRHDGLLQRQTLMPTERIILVMPTWRKNLLSNPVEGSKRILNPDFMETEYARSWNAILHNPRLEKVARSQGYRVIFFPHSNVQPYLPLFKLPEWVEALDHSVISIQELFAHAALMITDYSSVAFDFTYLKKSVIYYQFDEQTFFAGVHVYQKGYFNYRRDGFGPVCTTEDDLIDEVEHLIARNAELDHKYLERIEAFFPAPDGRNCERVYKAIVALDQPMAEEAVNHEILVAYAHAASHANEWLLAESRWRTVQSFAESHAMPVLATEAQLHLIPALRHTGRLLEARQFLDGMQSDQLKSFSVATFLDVKHENALLAMEEQKWTKAINILQQIDQTEVVRHLMLQCHAQARGVEAAARLAQPIECLDASRTNAWVAAAQGNWHQIVELLADSLDAIGEQKSLRLLLVRAYRELDQPSSARAELDRYANELGKDRHWTCESARLFIAESRWKDAISFFGQSFPEGVIAMPIGDGLMLVKAQRMLGNLATANAELELLEHNYPASVELIFEKAELAERTADWGVAAECWRSLSSLSVEAAYREAEALRKIGQTSNALIVLKHPSVSAPQTLQQLLLRAELAHLEEDYTDAVNSWTRLLRHYPDKAPPHVWERLGEARIMLAVKQNS